MNTLYPLFIASRLFTACIDCRRGKGSVYGLMSLILFARRAGISLHLPRVETGRAWLGERVRAPGDPQTRALA